MPTSATAVVTAAIGRLVRAMLASSLSVACCAAVLLGTAYPAHAQVEETLREADRFFEEGRYKRAAQRYDQAIEQSPRLVSAEAYGNRAAIFIIQKDYRGGLQFITQVAEPEHGEAAEVQEQKALILWALRRRSEAIQIADRVAADRSDMYSLSGIIGEFYTGRDPARAAAGYAAYFKYRPESLARTDVLPRVRLGFSYLALERYKLAEEQFQILLSRHRDRPHAERNAKNGLCAAYAGLGQFDRAITLCEQISRDPRNIDRSGSVWYNLGRSYLAKKQTARAREAGERFIRLRQASPKGYILVGDSYFEERSWSRALQFYLDAEQRSKGGRGSVGLGIKLGATYRRLGRPQDAIAKLESVSRDNPDDPTLASELGSAHLAAGADDAALAAVQRLIEQPSFVQLDDSAKVDLLLIAGRSLYNQGQHGVARRRYQAAYGIRRSDVTVRIGLIQTINVQAFSAISKGEFDRAEAFLGDAYQIDRKATITNRNLAVLALSRNRCDRAATYLKALADAPGEALMYHRLRARAYLCQKQPDRKRAAAHYAQAEKRALDPNLQANLLRAEIYTEWAPLLFDTNLDDAIDKLETAVQLAARNPEVGDAARRNLAVASYRRGWRNMRSSRYTSAVADFRIAARDKRLLRGTETLVFAFSLALAYLENGETTRAVRQFSRLVKQGQRERVLKQPFDRLGVRFFDAYAKYRSGNRKLRRQATRDLSRLRSRVRGPFGERLREIITSNWLYLAVDAYRSGDIGEAKQALKSAEKYAITNKNKRIVENNQLALALSGRSPPRTAETALRDLAANVPEALANLGILYDRQGRTREAYDA
ncbi:MAG: tetratricopeptide repeat protein, partial [Myxococcota bacterium]